MENSFLASLSHADFIAFQPLLKPVELKQKTILFDPGQTITKVYFPTSAIVSLVVLLSTGESVEAAMVGRDGMVGGASTLDGKIAICRAVVQVAGEGVVCDGKAFKSVVMERPSLLGKVIRHEQTVYAQAQQSAACMATHQVEARMARWLLRSRDLAGKDTLPFTQEFLAEMLGVRRTSVTVVANGLQTRGLIDYHRGVIQIKDIKGLRLAACECYATINKHYKALLNSRD